MAEVASLELKVKTNADDAADSLKKLSNAMSGVQDACTEYTKKIKSVSRALGTLAEKSKQVQGATANVKEVVKDAQETVTKGDGKTGGETSAKGNWMTMIAAAAKSAQPAIKGITAAAKVAGKVMKFAGKSVGVVAKGVKKLVEITGIADFAKNAARAASRVGILGKQLLRIATYRALRAVLKEISQSFREGANNAYQWAQAVGNSFAPSADRAATAMLYMKNSLGAMIMPLVNALVPALDLIITKFVELINKVNQFIATFTGASTWTKALKYPTKIAEATAKAGSELKRTLLGFDEINRLDDNNGSGSSAAEDASKMFEELSTNGGFAETMRQMIENGQWNELARLLAYKVNGVVSSLDVKEVVTNFCKKINQIMDAVNNFMGSVNWQGIGDKLSEGVNAVVDTINPQILGQFLSNKFNAIVGIVKGFVEGFEWGAAGTWLSNVVSAWFEAIQWNDLMTAIGKAINGIFDFAHNFITNINWPEKAAKLADAINKLIDIIDWGNVGETINSFVQTLLDGALEFFDKLDWAGIGEAIYKTLSKIDWLSIFGKVASVVWEAVKGLFKAVFHMADSSEGYSSTSISTMGPRGFTDRLAGGGIPSTGSLFWAGEAGPELVGQVGGHNSVINANQFAEGMAYANDGVINAVLAIGDAIVNAVNNVDVNPQLDGMALARGLSPYSKRVTTLAGNSLVNG